MLCGTEIYRKEIKKEQPQTDRNYRIERNVMNLEEGGNSQSIEANQICHGCKVSGTLNVRFEHSKVVSYFFHTLSLVWKNLLFNPAVIVKSGLLVLSLTAVPSWSRLSIV